VVEDATDVEMLECLGTSKDDGSLRRCDGKHEVIGNETGENTGWASGCCA
jgi:hypothetical protein